MSEFQRNIFSQHYQTPVYKPDFKNCDDSDVRRQLKSYTHNDAIEFASCSFGKRHCPELPSGDFSIQEFSKETGTRAYYKVVLEKRDKYILVACHANVHGYHRGDLRFIEVNSSTVTRGTEEYSVLGKLYLGDTVAVTELSRLRDRGHQDVFQVRVDQPCVWMASKMTILTRDFMNKVTFSVLKDQEHVAVVKGHSELMSLPQSESLKPGQLYHGDAFIPHKSVNFFTEDHNVYQKNPLVALTSKIHQPPNPLATIFNVYTSEELTEQFEIGQAAFSTDSSQAEEIVETCVLMGYAAASSVGFGRLDTRAFPMENARMFGRSLTFEIDNPQDKPTEGKWNPGNRLVISTPNGEHHGVVDTVLVLGRTLKMCIRLSKQVPSNMKFNEGLHIVAQREPLDNQLLTNGFIADIPEDSNGRRILEALYGGPKIKKRSVLGRNFTFPGKTRIQLNPYQAEYVEMLTTLPIVVASSPFGCGKSLTIVTAAYQLWKEDTGRKQILLTQSNFASVNLVEIASKIQDPGFRFVRFLSEKNAQDLPDDCLTDYDLPVLMKREFLNWAQGEAVGYKDVESLGLNKLSLTPGHRRFPEPMLLPRHMFTILNFALRFLDYEELGPQAMGLFPQVQKRNPNPFALMEAFFALYNPNVIMTTADSLQSLLSYGVLWKYTVSHIQIDEASQLPEYSFIGLLTQFPRARYGMIGDIRQLPPYCEVGLEGKLKEYGIGNTMERAVRGELFPQAMLREVYRCHPKTTRLLSDLFYEGKLISGVKERDRSEFIQSRSDFWPKSSSWPIMVINNSGMSQKMGTSCGNNQEKEVVMELLDILTRRGSRDYQLRESDIGIISFYKAQTSILTDALRGRRVKCGTVDAFQGTEKDVVILCCTNEMISDFMQDPLRLNVAMSRAKQVTIIVGNMEGLKKAKFWKTIVEKAEDHGCVTDMDSIGKVRHSQNESNENYRYSNGRDYGRQEDQPRNYYHSESIEPTHQRSSCDEEDRNYSRTRSYDNEPVYRSDNSNSYHQSSYDEENRYYNARRRHEADYCSNLDNRKPHHQSSYDEEEQRYSNPRCHQSTSRIDSSERIHQRRSYDEEDRNCRSNQRSHQSDYCSNLENRKPLRRNYEEERRYSNPRSHHSIDCISMDSREPLQQSSYHMEERNYSHQRSYQSDYGSHQENYSARSNYRSSTGYNNQTTRNNYPNEQFEHYQGNHSSTDYVSNQAAYSSSPGYDNVNRWRSPSKNYSSYSRSPNNVRTTTCRYDDQDDGW